MVEPLQKTHCGTGMKSIGNKKIQLGETSWIFGDLPNLIAGALEIEIFVCQKCGKVEFYQVQSNDDIEKAKCPSCGQLHDMDYPKCPFCKHNYYA